MCLRSCMPHAWRCRFSSNLRESKTQRYPFTESFHLRVFGGLLKLHNWISPCKSEAKARYQWYTTNAVVFTRGPLRLRVSTQELILHRHCLVGYTTSRDFPFFPALVHSSFPPTFLLSRLHFPNYLSFANPIVVMSLHSVLVSFSLVSLAIRSMLPDASRHSRAVLLAASTSSPFSFQIEQRESSSVLSRFWMLSLTLLHRSGWTAYAKMSLNNLPDFH